MQFQELLLHYLILYAHGADEQRSLLNQLLAIATPEQCSEIEARRDQAFAWMEECDHPKMVPLHIVAAYNQEDNLGIDDDGDEGQYTQSYGEAVEEHDLFFDDQMFPFEEEDF